MGIVHEVFVSTSGPVAVRNPQVVTRLNGESEARLSTAGAQTSIKVEGWNVRTAE